MKKNNENEWLDSFKNDLKKLEDMYEPNVPQQIQLMGTLKQFKAERKKAFRRELAAFLVTALFVIASYAVIAFKLTIVFIWVQGLALFFVPIIFFAERRRRKSRNGVSHRGF